MNKKMIVYCNPKQTECGFILLSSLLLLILLTILGIAMSKSFGMQELMAGNQREKTRAFEAAQSALNYAEWWLNQGNNTQGSNANCTGISTSLVICGSNSGTPPHYNNNTPASTNNDPTQLDSATGAWVTGYAYQPTNMQISASGGVGKFYAKPMINIQYLGTNASTGGNMYQITALGFGGNVDAVAVVQSIFTF